MIAHKDLLLLAEARLKDAETLQAAGRYDGAAYVCGYCVELALKARICRTLRWDGFPSNNNEFQDYTSFRTHKFQVLLRMSGARGKVKDASYAKYWSTVGTWSPDARYQIIGTVTEATAARMLDAAGKLMRAL